MTDNNTNIEMPTGTAMIIPDIASVGLDTLTSFEKYLVNELVLNKHHPDYRTLVINLKDDSFRKSFTDDEVSDSSLDIDKNYLENRFSCAMNRLRENLKHKELNKFTLTDYDDIDDFVCSLAPATESKLLHLAAQKILKVCLLLLIEEEKIITFSLLRNYLFLCVPNWDETDRAPFIEDISSKLVNIERKMHPLDNVIRDDKILDIYENTNKAFMLYQEFSILSDYDQKDAIFIALCMFEKYIYSNKEQISKNT